MKPIPENSAASPHSAPSHRTSVSAWRLLPFAAMALAAAACGTAAEKEARRSLGSWENTAEMADFDGGIPACWPLCPPFCDDDMEMTHGFLVVERVKPCVRSREAGMEPGDILLSWGTGRPQPEKWLADAWLSFLQWKRHPDGACWFLRLRDGRPEVFSCDWESLFECEASWGTCCLQVRPAALPRDEAERIRDAAGVRNWRGEEELP